MVLLFLHVPNPRLRNRRNLSRVALAAACGLGAGVVAATAVTQRPARQASVADLLARYDRGDRTAIVTHFDAIDDYSSVRTGVEGAVSRWLKESPASDVQRRRLIGATFALEVARTGLETAWVSVRPLVEFGCELVRQNPPTPTEEIWQLASIALAERARDTRLLLGQDAPEIAVDPFGGRPLPPFGNSIAPYGFRNVDHLSHARGRFPLQPRFRLAEAVVSEPALENVPPRDRSPNSNNRILDSWWSASLARFIPLLDDDVVGAEAHLRSGSLLLRLRRPEPALQHLAAANRVSTDPFVTYLARYFAGEGHELRGRRSLAEDAYRGALEIVPGAQSGVARLSALLFLLDDRRGADDLVSAAFRLRPPPEDPWRLYSYGDFRRWGMLIASLRGALP